MPKLYAYFFEVREVGFFKLDFVSDAKCHERVFEIGVPRYNHNTYSVEGEKEGGGEHISKPKTLEGTFFS